MGVVTLLTAWSMAGYRYGMFISGIKFLSQKLIMRRHGLTEPVSSISFDTLLCPLLKPTSLLVWSCPRLPL